ncbi:MAG: 16S ribosomal RNA methyltransferase A [Methanomicrobiales archaeon]|nr:16S ribosomal RNA methyltransferase A [Methanomicrobiales archaeon]
MSAPKDQHFLVDPRTVERILSLLDVSDHTVLEIGPGTGILTRGLLNHGAEVIAVELDHHLCTTLALRFGPEIDKGQLLLIESDATCCDLPPFEYVVANLPYSISSKITFRLLDIGFTEAVLMYQKEFAERMVARPGTAACGRLSIMAQTYADVEACFDISPRAFNPMPMVRSTVVRLIPHEPRFFITDRKFYSDVVRVLFSHRRKTVRNGLKSFGGSLDHRQLERILGALSADILSSRPEELQLEDFAVIANAGTEQG